MMTDVSRIFVDINILIYATVDAAPFHTEARRQLDQLWENGAELYISHQVIREYITNATRPQTYRPALSIDAVLEQVQNFRKTFYVLPDSPAVLLKLLEVLHNVPVGGKQVHDANIVATMLVNAVEALLTHNPGDFERFQSYIRVRPLTEKTK